MQNDECFKAAMTALILSQDCAKYFYFTLPPVTALKWYRPMSHLPCINQSHDI
jgi:hypothetical protein